MTQRDSRHIIDGRRALVSEKDRAPREAANAYRQVVRLEEMIQEALEAERFNLKPAALMELNRFAVDGLTESPGRYRLGVSIIEHSKHEPPGPDDVPGFVDELCDYVNDNWALPPLHLAAYTMWRVNWIHPFEDGNGRTARAASYLVLCARLRRSLPGETTIPDQLVEDKDPYYAALEQGDSAYKRGKIHLKALEDLLDRLLVAQVRGAASSTLKQRDTVMLSGSQSVALARTGPKWTPTVIGSVITAVGGVIAALIGLLKCTGG